VKRTSAMLERDAHNSSSLRLPTFAYGQKRTLDAAFAMSGFTPPKADITERDRDVRFVPDADIRRYSQIASSARPEVAPRITRDSARSSDEGSDQRAERKTRQRLGLSQGALLGSKKFGVPRDFCLQVTTSIDHLAALAHRTLSHQNIGVPPSIVREQRRVTYGD
jgi:hypothetical protein